MTVAACRRADGIVDRCSEGTAARQSPPDASPECTAAKRKSRRDTMGGLRSILSSFFFLAVLTQPSVAQRFPAKPITMVVPYAPGGNVDVTARVLQAAIGDALGQPVVIEIRPGGAGLIAGDYVARADPDGHTLLVGSNGPVILGPLTMAKPAYQWEQAFAPVSSLAVATNLLLVRPSLPVKSVKELVDYAKNNPNKLTLATSSVASINHFLGELFKLKAGITWTEVHYRGNALAINDLIAGHVDVGFQQLVDAAQHLQSGKLRALAVPGKARAATLPDVPTMADAGYPEVDGVTFNGIFAPKATPRPVVERLSGLIRSALAKQSAIDQLAALGSQARGSTPEEFTGFLQGETRRWGELVRAANIKSREYPGRVETIVAVA